MKNNLSQISVSLSIAVFQFLSLASKFAANKVGAIFLGADGVGLMGVFNSIFLIVKTASNLGLPDLYSRDISYWSKKGDEKKTAEVIMKLRVGLILLAFLIVGSALILSYYIADVSFGNTEYQFGVCVVLISIFFAVAVDGELATRRALSDFKSFNKIQLVISLVASATLIFGIWWLGVTGVYFAILASSVLSLLLVNFFKGKHQNYYNAKMNYAAAWSLFKDSPILAQGIALVLVALGAAVYYYLLKIYIRDQFGWAAVGYYHVATVITSGYFIVLIGALQIEFQPRASALHDSNEFLVEILNQQMIFSMLILLPVISIFRVFVEPITIFLFSADFIPAVEYLKIAVYGVLFFAISSPFKVILIAKRHVQVYLIATIVPLIICYAVVVNGYLTLDLTGLALIEVFGALFTTALYQAFLYYHCKVFIGMRALLAIIINIFFLLLIEILFYLNQFVGVLQHVIFLILPLLTSILLAKFWLNIDLLRIYRLIRTR